MILIFSRNADASPQIKREVERAVNKGVYVIPFRVEDIPPTKSLEYFISTSQWMDAFSPPLERHLDNLAKTVQAVLKRPPLTAVNVPSQPEKPSIPTPRIHPPRRKSILIAALIAALVIVGGAGWFLVQKKKGPPEKPAMTPIGTSTLVPITPAAVTPVPTLVPTPVPTLAAPSSSPPLTPFPTLTPPTIANIISDDEVRNFVTSFFRGQEQGDLDYVVSQFDDPVDWGGERRDKAFLRKHYYLGSRVVSFTIGDVRVEHSDSPDRVTAYFDYRFLGRDSSPERSNSGRTSGQWVISKTSGALKIVSAWWTMHADSPSPSPPIASMIDDEEVREFVINHYRARERRDLDYVLGQYGDVVNYFDDGPRNKAFIRNDIAKYFTRWPEISFTPVGDVRFAHTAREDTVTVYFAIQFLVKASGRSQSGSAREEWVISKTSGALKIVSQKETVHRD